MPIHRRWLPGVVVLALLAVLLPRPSAAQDHAMPEGMMMGMPELNPIPSGSLETAADVQFMQGMIAHHAQAIYMSHLAAQHGADPHFLIFAQKIDQSQTAEIRLMQGWLVDHGQVAPDTASYHHMMMPGMLTKAQLDSLASLQGRGFDRLFLTLMIRHHQGALGMVHDLLTTPHAAQDVDVNVLANDIVTVQTAEIDLMQEMLANIGGVH